MDIRSSLNDLKTLFGVTQPAAADLRPGSGSPSPAAQESVIGADSATVSSAASQVAQTATDPGVRMDKVAAVRSALAAGTYRIDASAIASRLVDSMLGAQ